MGAGRSSGGPPARLQFAYRPYVLTVPWVSLGIFEDTSTPAVVTTTGTTNPTTASFSPPANTLLVALVGGGFGTTLPTSAVVTDTGSHVWTVGARATGVKSSAGGVALIAYTYLLSAPGGIQVNAAFTNRTGGSLLAVRVLNNVSPSQVGAGSGTAATTSSTAGTVGVTTTVTGSQIYGISDDAGSSSDGYTLNGATVALANGTYVDGTDSVELVAWKATTLTTTPGPTTVGGTWGFATSSSVAALEILPFGAPVVSIFPPVVQIISQAVMRAACI